MPIHKRHLFALGGVLARSQSSKRMGSYEVLAGEISGSWYYFMVLAYANGTRELYWNDGMKSGTDAGTHRIEGDRICVTWKNAFEGKEQCFDVYKIGPEKYEAWLEGKLRYMYVKVR